MPVYTSYFSVRKPVAKPGQHSNVTGFYQRTKKGK